MTKSLTTAQAATRAKCSRTHINRAVNSGELPAEWVGVWLIKPADLDKWNRSRKPAGRPRKRQP